MDTLGYLHLSSAYENSETINVPAQNLKLFTNLSRKNLSSSAWIRVMSVALALSIMSVTSNALAIQRGDKGTSVTNLQQNLITAGYYNGPVTGFYGSLTQSAVVKFQRANGLTPDGIAGSRTLAALENRGGATPIPSNPAQGSLRRGSNSQAVANLQRSLKASGYYNGPVTGFYGSLTEAAVRNFQASQGLRVDGIAGASTLTALRDLPSGGGSGGVGGTFPGSLRRGSSGPDVVNIQNRMRTLGIYDGPVTGFYGSQTEAAVRNLQLRNGLPVDGIVGRNTFNLLY
ncbi:MAG: peptidoglycan-binding protein [Kastovskya adunca ATA6-11-RM4]|jgi:peptidoglycan hydrolase-like protein with peptidoglycan-binding domain|nr:peptidoglycan-binding protein [Kastovskya adunca ATA6-11-RM4]